MAANMAEKIPAEDTFDGKMEELKEMFRKLSCISMRSDVDERSIPQEGTSVDPPRSNPPSSNPSSSNPSSDKPDERGDAARKESKEFEYNMKHNTRGILILFNVATFNVKYFKTAKEMERLGTDKDASDMKKTFECMGFDVWPLNNPTGDQVIETLKYVAKADHTNMDCVAVGFLSHGTWGKYKEGKDILTDVIYTHDEKLKMEKITEPFRMKNCHKSLRGKPKLFFIQACRGDKLGEPAEYEDNPTVSDDIPTDKGTTVKEDSEDAAMKGEDEEDIASGRDEQDKEAGTSGRDEQDEEAGTSGREQDKEAGTSGRNEDKGAETSEPSEDEGVAASELDEDKSDASSGGTDDEGEEHKGEEDEGDEDEGEEDEGDEDEEDFDITGRDRQMFAVPEKMPIYQDFLVAWSTAPGYLSHRNADDGSVFIQTLCKYLNKYHASADLLSILTWCNSEIAHKFKSYAPSTVNNPMKRNVHEKKQMPWYFSRLTKEVYFPPKPKKSLLEQIRSN